MTGYTVCAVAVLAAPHLWAWTNLKTTILWWLTVGFASVFQARRLAEERGGFRKLFREALNVTAIITFIAEFGSFPLPVELVLPVPLTFIAGMLAVAPSQPKAAVVIKPLTWILILAGLSYLGWSVHVIANNPTAFHRWNTLREFGDPILLSIAFIPFLFSLAVVMTHETIFTSLRVMWSRQDLARYAQRRALWSFGGDLDGMRRLARDLKMNDIEDRSEVEAAIRQIKRLKRREKHPPSTPPDQGWSPYTATRFLEGEGLIAGDWHPSFGEWRAEASMAKLSEAPLSDSASYYLSGSEFAATRLSLELNADLKNDTAASDGRFYRMVHRLLERALPPDEATPLFERLGRHDGAWASQSGCRLSMRRDDWGDANFGGYSRSLTMTHPAHIPNGYNG